MFLIKYIISLLFILSVSQTSFASNYSAEELYKTCFGSRTTVLSKYFSGKDVAACRSWFREELAGELLSIDKLNQLWEENGGLKNLGKEIDFPSQTSSYGTYSVVGVSEIRKAKRFSSMFSSGWLSTFKDEKQINNVFSTKVVKNMYKAQEKLTSLEYSYNYLNFCYSDKDNTTFFLKELISKYNFLIYSNSFFDSDQIVNMTRLYDALHSDIDVKKTCAEIKKQINKNMESYVSTLKDIVSRKSKLSLLCGNLEQSLRHHWLTNDSSYFRREKTSRVTPFEEANPLAFHNRIESPNKIDSMCKSVFEERKKDVISKLIVHIQKHETQKLLQQTKEKEETKRRVTIQ